ncbi:rhodanese-like domain-containing protein [Erythrobacter sp. JK5]|uniref:rhodanese-like domain-containing protein n=1 Tax=Erythrobacter sp. JK5 TaxID=2829500 RepID=UPI001BAB6882|nr:rhodanese-like domain-containing protein [Erythrobacter sp. JK5]QUL37753.1 rhodanese-like domain-containing protein [Erythrobacter sp. JK5]
MKLIVAMVAAAPLALAIPAAAQDVPREAVEIDYRGFAELTDEVAEIRAARLLGAEAFFARAAESGSLILDTRSAQAFQLGHLEGAVNLPFSDFTEETLREVIGEDKGRTILIYCNNNFSDDVVPVALKKAPLALNIPTFINLVGYGYTNVWELGDTVAIADVGWVSPLTEQLAATSNEKAALAQ